MSKSDDFYTPEHVDDQVDALLHAREIPIQDQPIAHHLRSILLHLSEKQQQADAQVLQRVLQKFLNDPSFTQGQDGNRFPFTGHIVPLRKQERPVMRTKAPRNHSFGRLLTTLAAVLVVAILVGSMALVLHSIRQPSGSTGASAHQESTPTPTITQTLREGQIVYTSHALDLARTTVWSPDGTRVATAIDRTTVESWDALTGKNVITYKVSSSPEGIAVSNVAWSPDGSTLAVCEGSTIYLFNARTAHLIRPFSVSAQASGNGATPSLVTATSGTTLLSSMAPLSGGSVLSNVVWSPDGTEIASAFNVGIYPGSQHTIYVWNVASGQVVKMIQSNTNIPSVNWAPKGNLLAAFESPTTNTNSTLLVWNTSTWTQVHSYSNVASFDWSPDGTQLALGKSGPQKWNATIEIVDAQNGSQVKQFSVDGIDEIHWSPDGTRLLVGTGSIWSVSSGKMLYRFPGGASEGAWSPDSKYISCFDLTSTVPRTSPQWSPQDEQSHIQIWVA